MTAAFPDRVIERARAIGAPLCVGLDPFADRIPALFGDARAGVAAVEDFCLAVLERAAPHAAAVKPQLGLFEPYGADGVAAVQRLCAAAKAQGLPVILDAKRGDIGTTAEGYARAAFQAFGADCVTVNPYMGVETIEPFLAAAEAARGGVAVLVRTSNPGAADFQGLEAEGQPIWAHVARAIAPHAGRLTGASGWSGLMAVVGATSPREAEAARALLPTALFLVPGYGAQGGSAADAVAGFTPGPKGLEGGVVNASRAVLYPQAAATAGTLDAWRAGIDAALAGAVADLAAAAAR